MAKRAPAKYKATAAPGHNCPTKCSFATESEARAQISIVYFHTRIRLYTYQCPRCEYWHLTKQEH